MSRETEALIAKGRRSLAAGRRLFENGDYDFAASRAYYAMFYLAEALLLSQGMAFSKHSAVIAAFGQHFVKPGHMPARLHDALRSAFDERNVGDYDFRIAYPADRAESVLAEAQFFVDTVQSYLEKGSGQA